MKKYLLALVAAAATAFGAMADGMVIGICDENDPHIYGQDSATRIGQAIKISGQTLQVYKGAKITAISFPTGAVEEEAENAPSKWKLYVFMNDKMSETGYIRRESGNMDLTQDKFAWQEITLTEPYEITEETPDLYFGFYGTPVKYVRPILMNKTATDAGISFLGMKYSGESATTWTDCGSLYGQAMIRVKIEGDDLPVNGIEVGALTAPQVTSPGLDFGFTFTATNVGTNTVDNISVTYGVGDDAPKSEVITLEKPLSKYGERAVVSLTTQYAATGAADLNVVVTQVNGNDNTAVAHSASRGISFINKEDMFERNVVLEEYTGIACPNCPVGIYGIEEMVKKYPGTFLPIAIHSSVWGPAILVSNSYQPGYVSDFNKNRSAPHSMMNRTVQLYPRLSLLEPAYLAEREKGAIVKIDVTGMIKPGDPDGKDDRWIFDTETTFAFSSDNANYAIACVITEDQLGPVDQANNYAGWDENPDLGPWVTYDDYQEIMLNHVACDISYFIGNNGSIPDAVEKGEPCFKQISVDNRNVYKPENCHVTAMVINRETRQIENAVRRSFTELGYESSISEIEAVSSAAQGIYDLQGRRVANPGRGLYIVNGKKTLLK